MKRINITCPACGSRAYLRPASVVYGDKAPDPDAKYYVCGRYCGNRLQALRCRCIYRSKPQDCRRFSVPLRRAAPPEQSRLPALRRGLYAAQAEARRTQSPAHGRISSFRARGNLFLCISGVNALHGLTDTIRALGVREVVEAIGLDQMTNPNVRKAVLAMRKEVQKISAFAIQSTHGKPPAREWTIPS